jgi:hypothetical protein
MEFGKALELCRRGKRIYREGWNGKNQFVYYQEGSVMAAEDARCAALKEWACGKGGLLALEIMGHFDIKTSAGVIQCGWLATQGDMLASDWRVFE